MKQHKWIEYGDYIERANLAGDECSVVGYARVSTDDQELNLQLSALKDAGCNRIYMEKKSTRKRRPVFEGLKDVCNRKGVKLIVWRLDRLGRDLVEIVLTVKFFADHGVQLCSLQEAIDLDTSVGMLMLNIMAAFAQYERDVIRERTLAGMKEAKKNGKVLGNPSKIRGEHKVEMLVDIWEPKLTNKQIMYRNGYKSTATLQNHFQGERGKVLTAKKLGPADFHRIKIARLREVAKQEKVPVRRLNEIISHKNKNPIEFPAGKTIAPNHGVNNGR